MLLAACCRVSGVRGFLGFGLIVRLIMCRCFGCGAFGLFRCLFLGGLWLRLLLVGLIPGLLVCCLLFVVSVGLVWCCFGSWFGLWFCFGFWVLVGDWI